jgi:hypothetical protein
MKTTKKTKISKLLGDKKAEKILAKYDFPCLTCPCARYEMEGLDIGTVCEMYEIDSVKLLQELNDKLGDKKETKKK